MPIELSTQEKYQIMQNRMASLINLYNITLSEKNGAQVRYGCDSDFDIDDTGRRAYHGINDMRPVVDIVKDADALWGEVSSQIIKLTDEYKTK